MDQELTLHEGTLKCYSWFASKSLISGKKTQSKEPIVKVLRVSDKNSPWNKPGVLVDI